MRLYDGATLIRVAHRWGVRWGSCSEEVDEYLATSCSSDKSLRVYQISVSATEFCCHNKWYKFSLIWFFSDLLQRQNSVVETKIFTNILQTTPSDLPLRRVAATCCWVARPAHKEWFIATTYCCNLWPSVFRLCPGAACSQVKFQV